METRREINQSAGADLGLGSVPLRQAAPHGRPAAPWLPSWFLSPNKVHSRSPAQARVATAYKSPRRQHTSTHTTHLLLSKLLGCVLSPEQGTSVPSKQGRCATAGVLGG